MQTGGCKCAGLAEKDKNDDGPTVGLGVLKVVPNWWSGQMSGCANSISPSEEDNFDSREFFFSFRALVVPPIILIIIGMSMGTI